MLVVHFISLKKIKRKAIMFANYEAMEKVFGQKILSKNYPLLAARVLTLILLLFAVAGTSLVYDAPVTGFDFAITIDASGSMLAQDYQPNRLEAAKDAAKLFLTSVPEETPVAVVSFAGAAFIKQELTGSKEDALAAVEAIGIELMGGTAVGEAMISSVNAILSGKNHRAIILLTDGKNNVGPSVEEAIDYAKQRSVTVHTIGIGTEAGGRVGNLTFVAELDTQTLERISERTGGKHYRAETEEELLIAYNEIAGTTIQQLTSDLSGYFLLAALIIFMMELVLVNTKYRTIP